MKKIFLTIVIIVSTLPLLFSKEAPTKLYVWGNNQGSILGFYKFDSLQQVGTNRDWKQVAPGRVISAGIKYDGTLWAWGLSCYWKENDTSMRIEYTPVQLGNENDWKMVAVYETRLMAIKKNGTMWTWGKDVNDTINPFLPKLSELIQFGIDNDWEWAEITAGYQGSCSFAMKTDSSLWSWGDNSWGQLGYVSLKKTIEPVKINSEIGWKSFSTNGRSVFAVKNDGSLWFWGFKGTKSVNYNYDIIDTLPRRIGFDNNWVSSDISLFPNALKSDGTLWAWTWSKSDSSQYNYYMFIDFNQEAILIDNDWKNFKTNGYNYSGLKNDGNYHTGSFLHEEYEMYLQKI